MPEHDDTLAALVAAVRRSPKYRHVSLDLIRRIGAGELANSDRLKEAVKATKNRLHRAGGAYLGPETPYGEWLAELRQASAHGTSDDFRTTCARLMRYHASTRERLPILDRFYATTLADLAPVRSVLDLACGLGPLTIPWMPLAGDATYHACDVYEDMMDFIDQYLSIAGVQGAARTCDVASTCPSHAAQVALILKSIPCLEQTERTAGARLLDAVNADHVLVSFPLQSLGGRRKNMADHYAARFGELMAEREWPVRRFEFATELAFLVTKIRDGSGAPARLNASA